MANMKQNEIVKHLIAAERSRVRVIEEIRSCIAVEAYDDVLYAALYFATDAGKADKFDSQNGQMKSLRTMFQRETEQAGHKLTFKLADGVLVISEPRERATSTGSKNKDDSKKAAKLSKAEEQVAKTTEGNKSAIVDSILRQMERAGVTLDDLASRLYDEAYVVDDETSEDDEQDVIQQVVNG